MKKYLLLLFLHLAVYTGFSQAVADLVSYTLPQGWYAQKTGDNITLLKTGMEDGNCRIVFFKPVKTVTDTVTVYTKYRNELVPVKKSVITGSTAVQKQTGPGWTSFSALQNTGTKGNTYSIAFYSMSDTKQTIFFAVYASDDTVCNDELDAIIQSVNLTSVTAAQAGNKTKAKKKVRVLPLKSLKAFVN
jgi:hypothetical protein